MDCQSRCAVCPIILSVYRSDYIRLTHVRLFYPSIVRLAGGRIICGLSESVSRLSNFSIGLSSDCQVGKIIYRLPESVSRLSCYSVGLSPDLRVAKIIYCLSD